MANTQSNGHRHYHLRDVHYDHKHGYGYSEAQLPHVQQPYTIGGAHASAMKQLHVNDAGLDVADRRRPPHVHAASMEPQAGKRACILAIARAVPPHKLMQHSYADFYFNVTNCQHMTQLKLKMERICERSGVETRHSMMTEEFLKEHPELYTPGTPSLEERHGLLAEAVPRLAGQAAEEALREWGRPAHLITHLVVVTLSGVAMPGADVRLVQLLGLRPCVRRVMLYMLGCYAGVTALRVAKDLAENNPGSRVLVCCSELSATTFRAPNESSPYNLVSAALFGDGAVALIVGAHPFTAAPSPANAVPIPTEGSLDKIERPIYEIHAAIETIIPATENIIQGSMKVEGLEFYLDRALPSIVSDHVASFCTELIKAIPAGESAAATSLQELFWAVHPGGPAVLNAVERAAKLDKQHLQASRHILSKYGNISASTVLFVLDELRKSTTPASPEWGVAIAFGPGITFEGVLLRRVA